ncbi:hypothetical protein K788_00002025 [Paraburkholderia caribensis MBA4]|uniref:Uncharacterized protein n=1 Tax=Paraburkholderia caribensis MBA4 TaxID=1323664 RepID=A0A0P0RIJ9_9BURK|nr:hypothetical protein K788_00002025 [Paraburkholderia caribensis MBA4]
MEMLLNEAFRLTVCLRLQDRCSLRSVPGEALDRHATCDSVRFMTDTKIRAETRFGIHVNSKRALRSVIALALANAY